MPIEMCLAGPAGEPVEFLRLIREHGISTLPPFQIDLQRAEFLATLPVVGRAPVTALVRPSRPGFVAIQTGGATLSPEQAADLERSLRHIFRLDQDLSAFYSIAAIDPELSWVVNGAGRMTRCLTVFEDVVKTILTTNCAWSATKRMIAALVDELGEPAEPAAEDGLVRHAFPTAKAMAATDETFYRTVIRAGYRATYLVGLARMAAAGEVDLEWFGRATPDELSDDDLAKQLLALPGIGPYAASHVMMMLGRCSRLVLDSWTRPTYAARRGLEATKDAEIVTHFAPYGPYAGLAFWLYLTQPILEPNVADANA
jgi:3-methyladenine DNA glycosylase/8-oxoguanine DNA glycosylase